MSYATLVRLLERDASTRKAPPVTLAKSAEDKTMESDHA